MIDALEKRLIEALKSVDTHGDVAPAHVHDPMTMLLRENAIQANLMRWDDVRGRYVLTGTGRRRTVEGSRAPGTVVSFRKRGIVGSGPLHTPISTNSRSRGWISLDVRPKLLGHLNGTILIYGATGYTGKLIAKSTVRSGSNAPDLRLVPELQLLAQSPRCAYYRFPVHTERSRGAPAFSGCRANEFNASGRRFVPTGIAPTLIFADSPLGYLCRIPLRPPEEGGHA